MTIGTINK